MARYYPNPEEIPLSDQIRALANDELLDFWEETQHLERFLEQEMTVGSGSSQEYERIILQELQFRSSLRCLNLGC